MAALSSLLGGEKGEIILKSTTYSSTAYYYYFCLFENKCFFFFRLCIWNSISDFTFGLYPRAREGGWELMRPRGQDSSLLSFLLRMSMFL